MKQSKASNDYSHGNNGSVSASSINASPLSREARIEWFWKSNKNPFSSSEPAEWRTYTDVETAIIEEAYQQKLSEAILDDYHINFRQSMQISNHNLNNQRPVKRVKNMKPDARIREERFLPNPISPKKPFATTSSSNFMVAATEIHKTARRGADTEETLRQIWIEKAAAGLIIEGKKAGKQREGEWMAKQLLNVRKRSGKHVWECCARLYSMESFLYKKMNESMRLYRDPQYEEFVKTKIETFGPFAVLLADQYRPDSYPTMTVYRGADLSEELIQQYQKCGIDSEIAFPAYTSTSRNQTVAEKFGNTLFIIHLAGDFCSWDLAPYSVFKDEEEQLLMADTIFRIISCNFDETKSKWIIYLATRSW